jgi:hypothetical protein
MFTILIYGSSLEKEVFLVQNFWTNMHILMSKCSTSQFRTLNFMTINVENVLSSFMLLMIWTMAIWASFANLEKWTTNKLFAHGKLTL